MTEAAKEGFVPIEPPPPYSGPPKVGPLSPVDPSDPTSMALAARRQVEDMQRELADMESLGPPGTRPREPVNSSPEEGNDV